MCYFNVNVRPCTWGALCGKYTVTREGSRVRRKRFVHGDGGKCHFVDANLKLPAPGDKMRSTYGYYQSLSYNKVRPGAHRAG